MISILILLLSFFVRKITRKVYYKVDSSSLVLLVFACFIGCFYLVLFFNTNAKRRYRIPEQVKHSRTVWIMKNSYRNCKHCEGKKVVRDSRNSQHRCTRSRSQLTVLRPSVMVAVQCAFLVFFSRFRQLKPWITILFLVIVVL